MYQGSLGGRAWLRAVNRDGFEQKGRCVHCNIQLGVVRREEKNGQRAVG